MRLLPAVLAAPLLTALPAHAQAPTEDIDRGSFIIYVGDKAVGAETFGIEGRADSVNAAARSYRTQRTSSGEEMVEKQMVLTLNRSEFSLRFYQSNETFRGQTLIKGVLLADGDTAFTIFQEHTGGAGMADRLVAPPGRMYVLDSGLYSLFNLICLGLHGKAFDSRPVTLLTLGTRDTVIEATATHLGTETIRWGSRPVEARKLQLSDGSTTFLAWVNPTGKMLRLAHQASRLRVERDAPPVKRRAATTPKPGG